MQKLLLGLRISERIFIMFWHGEKLSDIKSMCLVDYANYLHRRKDIEKAIMCYKKAIHFKMNNSYAYGGLAAAHVEKRLFDQALDYCGKALAINPNDRLFILLIITYKSLGKFELAEAAITESLKYFDNNIVSLYDRLSYTYWFYNIFDEAEYYCKEAIKLNPLEYSLHYHLAAIYSANKKYDAAIKEFEKVLELTSDKQYIKSAQKEMGKIIKYMGGC